MEELSCCTCAGVFLNGLLEDCNEPVSLDGRLLVEASLQQGIDSISGHRQMRAFPRSLDNWSHQDLCTAHYLVTQILQVRANTAANGCTGQKAPLTLLEFCDR